ncbi:MAG: DUF58 domain-containing protein [Candidatus Electrothrix sp. Rat3]|nr:DUF58 domain-containing protein [Candidatus Electrothrix rattekaaiensis]
MQYFFYTSYRLFDGISSWRKQRFTPAGLLVLAILAISAGLGMNPWRSTVYQVFALAVPLLAVALLFSLFFRVRISVKRRLPKFALAGESLTYSLWVDNHSTKQQKGLLINEQFGDPRPSFDEFIRAREPKEDTRNAWDRWTMVYRWMWLVALNRQAKGKEQLLPTLAPHGREKVRFEILPLHRGYLELTGITVSRPDPFGLFKACRFFPCYQRVLVLPKRYRLPQVDLPGSRRHQPGGVSLASSVGNSDEFVSLREYRSGDPLRRIHWKSWAKTGKLIVKNYQDEFFVRHGLVMDTFQEQPHSRAFEEAISLAASFVSTVETQESLLDLMFVGNKAYCFSTGRGVSHTDSMMEILACVQPCHDRPFSELSSLLVNHASRLSGCICILLSWDEQRQEMIRTLQGLGVPLKIIVVTEQVDAVVEAGPMLKDQENFHVLAADRMKEGVAGL